MNYRTLTRVALKVAGLFLIIQGFAGFVEHSRINWRYIHLTYVNVREAGYWDDLSDLFNPDRLGWLVLFLAGLYLFFGGKRFVNLVAPNKNYCVECGYNLKGCTGSKCPECGTSTSDS